MIDEKQADAPATTDVADAKAETQEQVWDEITGQDADHDSDETASDDAEVDRHDAASDEHSADTADKAVQDDGVDGSGGNPGKQDEGATRDKRLIGQISGQARKIAELKQQIANFQSEDSGESRTPEDLEELRDEYPDIVGPLIAQQQTMREKMDAMSFQLSRMAELQGAEIADNEELEGARLEEAHPGWFGFLREQGSAFSDWVNDQPATVRATAKANMDRVTDGAGVASMLSSYKTHLSGNSPEKSAPNGAILKRETSSKRKRQLDGARSIPTRGNQAATGQPQPGETDEDAIWKNLTRNR